MVLEKKFVRLKKKYFQFFSVENELNSTEIYSIRALTKSSETPEKRLPIEKRLPMKNDDPKTNEKRKSGIPNELKKFPDYFLLGPEQLGVIMSESKRICVRGEPGTGKTAVLLALLFINTAKIKHNQKPPNFQKVSIVVDKRKTEFWKYVEAFIDNFCDKTYANLVVYDRCADKCLHGDENLILVDESSPLGDMVFESDEKLPSEVKIVRTSTSNFIPFRRLEAAEWERIAFRNAYRCPTNIALRYTKIRREEPETYNEQHPVLPVLNSALHLIDERRSVKVIKYREDIEHNVECTFPS